MMVPCQLEMIVPPDCVAAFIEHTDNTHWMVQCVLDKMQGADTNKCFSLFIETPGVPDLMIRPWSISRVVQIWQYFGDAGRRILKCLAMYQDNTFSIQPFTPEQRKRQYLRQVIFKEYSGKPQLNFIFYEGDDTDEIPEDVVAGIVACMQQYSPTLSSLWSKFYDALLPETAKHFSTEFTTETSQIPPKKLSDLCTMDNNEFPNKIIFEPFPKRKKRTGKESDSFKYPFGLNILGDLKDLLFGKKE